MEMEDVQRRAGWRGRRRLFPEGLLCCRLQHHIHSLKASCTVVHASTADESNLLKNRFSLLAHPRSPFSGFLPLSLLWPEMVFRPFLTYHVFCCFRHSSDVLSQLFPLLIFFLSSYCILSASLPLFFSFSWVFISGVTQLLMWEAPDLPGWFNSCHVFFLLSHL